MLYVDQPIGTGFSFGTDNATSTVTAAPFVWTFMQAFFEAFPTYQAREFGLWTESYGGHYGPEFAGKQADLGPASTLPGSMPGRERKLAVDIRGFNR